jgi:hypothetical protein
VNQPPDQPVAPRAAEESHWLSNAVIGLALTALIADTLRGFPLEVPAWVWFARIVAIVLLFALVSGDPQSRFLGPGGHVTNPAVVRSLQVLRLLGLAGIASIVVWLALRILR